MRRVTDPPQVNKSRHVRNCYKNNGVRVTCIDHAVTCTDHAVTCIDHAVTCFNIAVKQGRLDIIGSYMPILLVRVPPVGIFS